MYIQSGLRNKLYQISKRNFLDDYTNYETKQIDMTLSGKYLYKYPKFTINYSNLSEYPSHYIVKELRETIKTIQDIKTKEIIIGAGANGILQNIIKILFKNSGNLVTPFLTFNQAEYAVTAMNGITKRVYMKENVKVSAEGIIKSVDADTKMIYICNPNNPTGMLMSNEEIKYIAENVNVYVIVDESAIEFSNKSSLSKIEMPDNIIVIKSLSKAYGIAGLRIGYMICSRKFKKIYEENITVNEVSGISCEYAKKILLSNNYKKNIKLIMKERKNIEKNLRKLNIEFYPSESNILFSKTKLSYEIIEKFNKNDISLMIIEDEEKNIHFRIAVQDRKTNRNFIKKCKKIL